MKRIAAILIVLLLAAGLCFGLYKYINRPGSGPEPSDPVAPVEDPQSPEAQIGEYDWEHAPKAPELTWLRDLEIPPYSGEAYAVVNGGKPFFDTDKLEPVCGETYYALDGLGRCTLAEAVVGEALMPTEKRGSISSVKPTGWHTDKYSFVDGEALYNRCHLIAHYLSGENANPLNLVTGTRYMNTDGMNALENMVGDYIKETGNHVKYRTTPVWTGDNLVCDGLLVEAWSIEDEGEDICFCIYAYNVQPGVVIDYLTGDNYADGTDPQAKKDEQRKKEEEAKQAEYEKYLTDPDVEGTYVLNTKKKTFHRADCDGIKDMSEKNRGEYTGSRNQLVLEGYIPCGGCNP